MMTKRIITLIAAAVMLNAAASVKWLSTTHDFGAFKEDDGKVTCDFIFVNDGTEAVSVRSARASCGCTTPTFTKTPVAPGDTGTVTVRFNPTGRPGRFSKSITLDLADGNGNSRHTLIIKGVVIGASNTLRSRYPVEAGSVKLRTDMLPFGTVTKGRAKSAFLEVYNASEQPLKPKWENVPKYIRVIAPGEEAIPPGELSVYTFMLTPGDTELYGILTDSVTLNAAGMTKPLKIDITAILEEDFSRLTPGQLEKAPEMSIGDDRVNFGEIHADEGVQKRTFVIENKGRSDLMLRRVYTTDPGVTVETSTAKIKKGKKATVTVTVDPSQLPADILNARIQVIANDPENPVAIVRAVGELK